MYLPRSLVIDPTKLIFVQRTSIFPSSIQSLHTEQYIEVFSGPHFVEVQGNVNKRVMEVRKVIRTRRKTNIYSSIGRRAHKGYWRKTSTTDKGWSEDLRRGITSSRETRQRGGLSLCGWERKKELRVECILITHLNKRTYKLR